MALELIVANLDGVPEALRTLYVADGDKFKLDVSGIEDTTGLKSALAAERAAAKLATKQATAWASLGKSPEEIKALVDAQAKAEADRLAQAGEWETLRKQQSDLHAQALAAMSETVAAKDRAISKNVVDAQAVSAIAAAKGNVKLLMPFVRGALKAVEVQGDYVVQVLNDKGEPRVNAKGDFLSVSDLVSEMRQDTQYGPLFEGSGASGGGKSSNSNANATITSVQATDKAAIGANLEAIAKGTVRVV